MKFKASLILVFYWFVTLGISVVLWLTLGREALAGMFLGILMLAGEHFFGAEASLSAWFPISIWLGWPFWYVLALLIAQALTLPMRATDGAPLGRRSLIAPSLASGMMAGCLIVGAIVTAGLVVVMSEAAESKVSDHETAITSGVIASGMIVWIGWTFYWLRKGRGMPPMNAYAEQCRFLLAIGLGWLLVGGLAFVLSWKVNSDVTAFFALMGAACTLSFAFQPAAFSSLMRRWNRRGHGKQEQDGKFTSEGSRR